MNQLSSHTNTRTIDDEAWTGGTRAGREQAEGQRECCLGGLLTRESWILGGEIAEGDEPDADRLNPFFSLGADFCLPVGRTGRTGTTETDRSSFNCSIGHW